MAEGEKSEKEREGKKFKTQCCSAALVSGRPSSDCYVCVQRLRVKGVGGQGRRGSEDD